MAYKIVVSDIADAEADEAYHYIAARSPTHAARWYRGLLETIDTLQQNPERCPRASEADELNLDLRELLYGKRQHKYRILFTIEHNTVRVAYIRHAARRRLDE